MKVLALILAAALTPAALAATKYFEGAGEYRMADGTTGPYQVKAEFEDLAQDKYRVKFTYTVADKSFDVEVYNLVQANNFFDVMDKNDAKIGSGYCFDHQENGEPKKVCHCSFKFGDVEMEDTAAIKENTISRIGSTKHTEGLMVWNDKLMLMAQP